EIAKVFTRELELWTDTSHLRVRNKIQESIVDFNGSRPLSITSRDSNNFILNAPPPDVHQLIHKGVFIKILYPLSTLFPDDVHSDPQRQFEDEERDYLSNFGVNIVNEVLKRRVIIADRAKGAFISSISHELRNPLQRSKEVSDEACFVARKKRVYDLLHPNQSHHQQADYVLLMMLIQEIEDNALKQLLMNIIGISPSFLSTNMFQLFSQENSLQVGTGLGLSIVKIINNKNDDLGDFSNSLDSFNNENDNLIKDLKKNNEKLFFKKSNKKELVKELICEYKEKVTDSNLDCDIIFIVDNIDQLKKIISKVDTKQAPIVFTTTLAKHGKIADFVEKLQKEIEDTQLTQRKRRKVVILTRLCGPRKLEKAIVSVLSSQQDDEKLLEEENSYFPKLIMTPPISEDDNSKLYISYNSSEKSSNN
ncbi:14638_t:CDS:10, partial [Rhizophagus irregularis]